MDCVTCIVPSYGQGSVPFCNKCRLQLLQKSYCVALRESDDALLPFITLDDAAQASEYAGRLYRQGNSPVILSWSHQQKRFSHY